MKVSLLKQKDFSLLMFARLVSLIGTQMQDFALSLYVLKVTGSATKFASVVAIALIPQIILAPFAGVFADWFDRKKIIIILDLISGIVVGLFAFIFFVQGGLSLPLVYALAIILAVLSALYQPAVGTVIPSIIKKDDLMDANGLSSMVISLGSLAAPIVAGVLFGAMGLFLILILNSASFLIGSLSEVFINIPKTNKEPESISLKTFKTDFMEGVNFIKIHKIILTIVTLAAFINFIFAPLNVGLTYVSKQILRITDFQFGLLESSFVVSMMVAPILASYFAKKYRVGVILFWGILFSSMLLGVLAIIPSPIFLSLFKSNLIPYISIIILCFAIGLISTVVNIALSVMFQQIVPLDMMGRVGTVMGTCCMVCMPLGTALFGILYDKLAAWICLLISSVAAITIMMIFRKALTAKYEDDTTDTNTDDSIIAETDVDTAADVTANY